MEAVVGAFDVVLSPTSSLSTLPSTVFDGSIFPTEIIQVHLWF